MNDIKTEVYSALCEMDNVVDVVDLFLNVIPTNLSLYEDLKNELIDMGILNDDDDDDYDYDDVDDVNNYSDYCNSCYGGE